MYRIGEFAKLTGASIPTLRYYDEIGLLKPAHIDQFSNYRYYVVENINEFERITFLKNNGFSLEEILMYKNSITKEIIDSKINSLTDNIKQIENQIQNLTVLSNNLVDNKIENTNVLVKKRG